MKRIGRYLLLLMFLMIQYSGESQVIKHIGREDGLPGGKINEVVSDSLGYIWLASTNGISRYSGYEFRKYELDDIISSQSSEIICLSNFRGRILAGTNRGEIFEYNYETDKFQSILKIESRILSFFFLDNSKILIGSNTGLYLHDFSSNKTTSYEIENLRFIRGIVKIDEKVFVSSSKGVHNISIDDSNISLIKSYLLNKDVISLKVDNKDNIWVGTEKSGLFILPKNLYSSVIKVELKTNNTVRDIDFSKEGNAVVAVDREGFYEIDHKLEIINNYSHNPDDENSLRSNNVNSLYVDTKGVLWLGSGEVGVDLFYAESSPFENIYHILNEENSVESNSIRSIYQDKSKSIWFGTEQGLSILDSTGNWDNRKWDESIYSTPVLSIADYQNDILLGTYGKGVLKYVEKTNSFEENSSLEKLKLSLVFTMLSYDDNLWIGGNDGPLTHFVNGKVKSVYPIGEEKCIVRGEENFVYVGSLQGVFEINTMNQSSRALYKNKDSRDIFYNTYSLNYNKGSGDLWIGTGNGLLRYSIKENKSYKINLDHRQEIGTVYSIIRENNNILWLGTSTGLYSYSEKENFFRKFDQNEGVKSNEFGFGASAKLSDGRLAFGGPKGAVIFNPDRIKRVQGNSNLFISSFQVNGVESDSTILKENINFIDFIDLDYNQNSLLFTFEVVDIHDSKKNTYKWILEGYDKDTIFSVDNRTASYSKLPPGDYKLFASYIDSDGKQKDSSVEILINISKPFWLSWWAFLIYLIALTGLLYTLFLIGRSKQQQRIYDEKVKFFINVAHDIRTPISLIRLSADQILKNENVENSIRLIKRNSKSLSDFVSQLLEFQKAEGKEMKLLVSEIELKSFTEKIVSDFHPLIENKSMVVNVKIPETNIWFDKSKMTRVFNNLLSNAIKYSDEGSDINIIGNIKQDKFIIDFIDNGLGVPDKQQKHIFEGYSRGENVKNIGISGNGIGLILSKKIVEAHRGKITLESKENYGSKFSVHLPLGTEHFKNSEISIKDIQASPDNNQYEIIKNKTVLLVEDNKDLSDAIKLELEKYYRVIVANNGNEGLIIALDKNPDIIITDVMMPNMTGKELTQILKKDFNTSHIPIIMITALTGIDDKIEGLEVGADAYIEKPFNIELLKVTMNNLLRSKEKLFGSIKEIEKKSNEKKSIDDVFVSKIVEIINDNLTNKDFNIDVMCEKMGFSRSNLFRKLKGLTGMSPSDLIIKIKLNKAEELMKSEGNMRISDISFKSGFQDPKYFSTIFKKHYGMSPKDYIEKSKK